MEVESNSTFSAGLHPHGGAWHAEGGGVCKY